MVCDSRLKLVFLILAVAMCFCSSNGHESSHSGSALRPRKDPLSTLFRDRDTEYSPTEVPAPPNPPSSYSNGWDGSKNNRIDFLVAAFFLIAAGWLFLALLYALLVFLVVRLRSRGELDVFEDDFGRLYLWGRRCYIPLGCILRRYVIAMEQDDSRDGNAAPVRLMTREERRMAMEILLVSDDMPLKQEQTTVADDSEQDARISALPETDVTASAADTTTTDCDTHDQMEEGRRCSNQVSDFDGSSTEPMCSICLMEYEDTDICFNSTTCSHRFHRECIMDWLERRNNTECPCCRVPLVGDEEVWETVRELRKEKRKQYLEEHKRGFLTRLLFRKRRKMSTDARDEERTVGNTLSTDANDNEVQQENWIQAQEQPLSSPVVTP